MKGFTILACLLSVAAAVNPLLSRATLANSCECDISKCPPSGDKRCTCIVGLIDTCYVAQTHAGIDCGKPTYPENCGSSGVPVTPIPDLACGGSSGGTCADDEICYFPDKSCDPHTTDCTGLCASDYCGGHWEKECADDRWSCVLEDACVRSGAEECDGKCVLN